MSKMPMMIVIESDLINPFLKLFLRKDPSLKINFVREMKRGITAIVSVRYNIYSLYIKSDLCILLHS